MDTIVIVGASLAGTRAAETLRDEGYDGQIVMVGDEPHLPYDRPPLSKQLLSGEWDDSALALLTTDDWDDLDVVWRLGSRATGLDVAAHQVELTDGALSYDGLVIATGSRARRLATTSRQGRGVHTLRTLDDAIRLREALGVPERNLGIVGGGFIGSEVASVARSLGHEVTILERSGGPMAEVLGLRVAAELEHRQRSAGVDLRTGVVVRDVESDTTTGQVEVHLDAGSTLVFDEVLVSVGAVPNVEWLEGSGVEIDAGVVTDDFLAAAPDVVAAGDVVRVRNADGTLRRRIEHWTDAARQAEIAAANLLSADEPIERYRDVPYVWSDQFGTRIEVVGDPDPAAMVDAYVGSADSSGHRPNLFGFRNGSTTVGCVGVGVGPTILDIRRRSKDVSALGEIDVAELVIDLRKEEVRA